MSAFCFWAPDGISAPGGNPGCGIDRRDLLSEVRAVVDGDTLILADGRHVRFIGFNAPERAHGGRPAQPLAEAARRELSRRLSRAGNQVILRFGAERKDRYGRLLAHPFLPDGTNLSAALLRAGWGAAIAIPPNLSFQRCYREAETQARDGKRGVWIDAYYAPRAAAALDRYSAGFLRVRGRLERVGFGRGALWLQLGRLGIRIDKDNLPYFRQWDFHALRGREMEVRGWVTSHGGRPRLDLKHPNDLVLTGATPAAE